MLPNRFLLLASLFSGLVFSQEKKVDTIYVYEEVIVHDTIFIEKPLDRVKFDKAVFIKNGSAEKDELEVTQNGKKIQIDIDSTNIILSEAARSKTWFFGGKLLSGIADNSLFKQLNAPENVGLGLGIWTKKQIFNPNFFVGIGIDVMYWMSPFVFDATKNDSPLNGYYFTENNEPKLFQSIENKHLQFQVPVQFYYKIGRFITSIGVFAAINNYKATFLGSSGNLPLTFDETQVFKAEAFQIGFLAELQYELTEHIFVAINFSSGKAKNLAFTNKNDSGQTFKTEKTFTENRWLAQLTYRL
jgi:hypothetical protein